MLALKLALSPMLILIASLAARRWGMLVAGWIAGFPLTSGPVSIFLAVEQSPEFAANAARGTLVGVIAMIGFCVAYARIALFAGCWPSLLGGIACLLALATGLIALEPSLPTTLVLLFGIIVFSLSAIPRAAARPAGGQPPWWDIPLRMAAAVGLVVGLTAFADRLGPTFSGLISPVPIFASVLAVFTHRHNGGPAAAELLRGVILGAFSFCTFFVVTAFALGALDLVPTYVLAAAASMLVNVGALGLDRRRAKG